MENNKQPMAYDLHYDEIRQVLVKHLNEYPNQLVGDIAELVNTKKMKQAISEALTEAQQAGIDEAVEIIKALKIPNVGKENKPFYHKTRYNQALDDTIKALTSNK